MNNKQQVFVTEYLTCWNASEAARRAGYNGQSNRIGHRLLSNVDIQAEIKRRLDEKCMSADECLVRLADQARGSLEDFITDDGTISIAAARAAGKLHLLKAYTEPGEKSGGRIELYSAQSALELIGKHHKLFTDNINLKMTPDKLEAWLSDGEKPGESEFGDD